MQVLLGSEKDKRRQAQSLEPRAPAVVRKSKKKAGFHVLSNKPSNVEASDTAKELLVKRQAVVLQTMAEFVDQDSLPASLAALAGELHHRFGCDRVVIGLYHGERLRVASISQQARLDRKSAEAQLLSEAMAEACDQDALIHFPGPRRQLRIVEAHRTLAINHEDAELCTVPLCHQGTVFGALLFERTSKQPWSRMTLDLFRQIARVAAPMIALRRDAERHLWQVLSETTRRTLEAFLRPRHLAAKFSAFLLIATAVGAYFAPVTHRVTAISELVPIERRIITSPIMGYVDSVHARAGDRTSAGDLLVQLDIRDLEIERERWANEIRSVKSEFRAAMASHDRKEMAVTQAQLNQAQARFDLIKQQISRATLTAPTDGILVSGDLSQSIGAPVEQGDVLFEIAPTAGYQVHLQVDETDISHIEIGQTGRFSLKANPSHPLPFAVTSIHPVAQASDGHNRFRVEASLDMEPIGLRPGQTGVSKVDVGEARLLWIWTHRFVQWSRQKIWEWLG